MVCDVAQGQDFPAAQVHGLYRSPRPALRPLPVHALLPPQVSRRVRQGAPSLQSSKGMDSRRSLTRDAICVCVRVLCCV